MWERGLTISLEAYGGHVFWEFREVWDGVAGQWARLAERLAGTGVRSLDNSFRELQLEPVHRPLRAIFTDGQVRAVLDREASPAQVKDLERRFGAFLTAVTDATGVSGDAAALAAAARQRLARTFADTSLIDGLDRRDRAVLLVWLALARMGELAPGSDVPATSRAWYDELRLPGALAAGLREAGLDEADAWAVTDLVRVLLALPRPSGLRGPARTADGRLIDQWLARDLVRTAIGLNTWQGVEYLDRDRFETMLRWAVRLDAIEAGTDGWDDDGSLSKSRRRRRGRSRTLRHGSARRPRRPTTGWTGSSPCSPRPAGCETSDSRTEAPLTARPMLSPGPAGGTRSRCPPATRTRGDP